MHRSRLKICLDSCDKHGKNAKPQEHFPTHGGGVGVGKGVIAYIISDKGRDNLFLTPFWRRRNGGGVMLKIVRRD